MKKDGLLLVAAMLLFASAAMAGAKVEVCHIPPGNPANAHTINVSQNALPTHLAHGDYELDATGICCAVYPRCLWNARNCADDCAETCAARCEFSQIPPERCQVLCVNPCVLECRAFFNQCIEDNCP